MFGVDKDRGSVWIYSPGLHVEFKHMLRLVSHSMRMLIAIAAASVVGRTKYVPGILFSRDGQHLGR